MKYRDLAFNFGEVDATQFLGPDEDPVWRERLTNFDPELLLVAIYSDHIDIMVENYVRGVFPTEWLIRTGVGGRIEIWNDDAFRKFFAPSDPHAVTGQRELIYSAGPN